MQIGVAHAAVEDLNVDVLLLQWTQVDVVRDQGILTRHFSSQEDSMPVAHVALPDPR
jgi:hypothetical protein